MKIEYYEDMLEQEAINKYLNMIANDYNGELAKIFEEKYINKDKEIERLNNIIKETSEDLYQVVKWCTENKHNENTIERYLVVDFGTIVGKINEIRTELDYKN